MRGGPGGGEGGGGRRGGARAGLTSRRLLRDEEALEGDDALTLQDGGLDGDRAGEVRADDHGGGDLSGGVSRKLKLAVDHAEVEVDNGRLRDRNDGGAGPSLEGEVQGLDLGPWKDETLLIRERPAAGSDLECGRVEGVGEGVAIPTAAPDRVSVDVDAPAGEAAALVGGQLNLDDGVLIGAPEDHGVVVGGHILVDDLSPAADADVQIGDPLAEGGKGVALTAENLLREGGGGALVEVNDGWGANDLIPREEASGDLVEVGRSGGRLGPRVNLERLCFHTFRTEPDGERERDEEDRCSTQCRRVAGVSVRAWGRATCQGSLCMAVNAW